MAEYVQRPLKSGVSTSSNGDHSKHIATLGFELLNGVTKVHLNHLLVTGVGSYAAHKALNELYDALPGHADDLAEGYQGAAEMLLTYSEVAPRKLNTVEDALDYLREMTDMVNTLQSKMPYSEIVNDLDTIKSTINSGKYKLKFLK